MMYTSDHGQSLGEHGFYLHGTPPAVAPEQQWRVPYLVWMSQGFQDARGLSAADIIPDESFPHDFPFHSVMGAFEMRSDIYKPQYDIFAN
jgi:lipid A ethanolaminephosphotransferase